jgi:hypothetical protein
MNVLAPLKVLAAVAAVASLLLPELAAAFSLSDEGRTRAEEFRKKAKPDALAGLEDAVAWVKEKSYLDLIHKTSTVRVMA